VHNGSKRQQHNNTTTQQHNNSSLRNHAPLLAHMAIALAAGCSSSVTL